MKHSYRMLSLDVVNSPNFLDYLRGQLREWSLSLFDPDSGGFRLYDAPTGKILYEQLAIHGEVDMSLGNGEYEVVVREGSAWGQPLDLRVQLKWSGPEELTRYREVTKYRDVPYTVEKQQTVTTYEKVSLWKIIFGSK